MALDAHVGRRHAVPVRVLQQVAQQAAQQARVALHGGAGTVQHGVVVMGAFLRGQRQQVHLFHRHGVVDGTQPAGQQDFVQQVIQFPDVLFQPRAPLGIGRFLHQLQRQADARQRRAQFVRGVGQQRLVGAHQLFDLVGGAVEAARQLRHLVLAFHPDPGRQVARAQ